jgi:protein CpxP
VVHSNSTIISGTSFKGFIMNTYRSLLCKTVLICASASTGLAFAQVSVPDAPKPPPPMGMHPQMPGHGPMHPGMNDSKKEEMKAKHQQKFLDDMKVYLQLQPSQEAAWQAFATSMKTPHKRPARPSQAEIEKWTTPERIDKMMAIKQERDADMAQRLNATKTFYGTLTPAQQKVFDTQTQKLMMHGPFGKIMDQPMRSKKND